MSLARRKGTLVALGPTLLGLALLAHSPAWPADSKQTYAIDGAGLASCKRYAQAAQKETRDYFIFVGWMDGYITAMNREKTETYDLTPWQSTQTLAATLARFCDNHPSEKFSSAVQRLVNTLRPDRLRDSSKVLAVRRRDRTVLIYEDVLDEVAEIMREKGYLEDKVSEQYNENLKNALEKFQREKGITISGLPDQATLAKVLAAN